MMRLSFNGSYFVTRKFGVVDPAYSTYPGSRHPGTDYGLPANTPLVAGMGGRVNIYDRSSNIRTGRGKEVVITKDDKQRKTCHMNRIDVKSGQTVAEGQAIGLSGNTGFSSGPHLHDELKIEGQYIDLEKYLSEGGNIMFPNKGDLENFFLRTGWPGHKPNANDIAYWTTGTGNDGWAAGADNVWKDLIYSVTLYVLEKPDSAQLKLNQIKEIIK